MWKKLNCLHRWVESIPLGVKKTEIAELWVLVVSVLLLIMFFSFANQLTQALETFRKNWNLNTVINVRTLSIRTERTQWFFIYLQIGIALSFDLKKSNFHNISEKKTIFLKTFENVFSFFSYWLFGFSYKHMENLGMQ